MRSLNRGIDAISRMKRSSCAQTNAPSACAGRRHRAAERCGRSAGRQAGSCPPRLLLPLPMSLLYTPSVDNRARACPSVAGSPSHVESAAVSSGVGAAPMSAST